MITRNYIHMYGENTNDAERISKIPISWKVIFLFTFLVSLKMHVYVIKYISYIHLVEIFSWYLLSSIDTKDFVDQLPQNPVTVKSLCHKHLHLHLSCSTSAATASELKYITKCEKWHSNTTIWLLSSNTRHLSFDTWV